MSWKNSNFQIEHFILSEANGAWERYRLLKELLLDREAALATIKATIKKQDALIAAVEEAEKESEKLNAQADLLEFEATLPILERDIKFAEQEKEFIQSLIDGLNDELETTRLQGYSDEKMFQEVQCEEWLITIKNKIRRELACTGTLNPESLRVAMNHPQYETELLPHIKTLRVMIQQEPEKLLEAGNLALPERHSGRGNVQ